MQATRHHILYPHRIWAKSYSGDNKKRAAFLRGKFIIKLPENLHAMLHQQVDVLLPEVVMKAHAPNPATIAKVYLVVRKNESEIEEMAPMEKIEWLLARFDPHDEANGSVILSLGAQLDFLRAHEGEY